MDAPAVDADVAVAEARGACSPDLVALARGVCCPDLELCEASEKSATLLQRIVILLTLKAGCFLIPRLRNEGLLPECVLAFLQKRFGTFSSKDELMTWFAAAV